MGWRIASSGWKSSLLQEMSKEQFKAFLEAVKADTALQEKLKYSLKQGADAVVAIAKEAGFVIRDCDLGGDDLVANDPDLVYEILILVGLGGERSGFLVKSFDDLTNKDPDLVYEILIRSSEID